MLRTSTFILALILAACDSQGVQIGDAGTDERDPFEDTDGDHITDSDEGREEERDSDGDGFPDYLDGDSDNDGIPDSVEAGDVDLMTSPKDSDGDGTWDCLDLDSDDNGVLDEDEGSNDTDGDGRGDFADVDNDGDELPDTLEIGGNPSSPVDTDGDGIPDYMDIDSDNDTISDEDETNLDSDEDLLPDYQDLDTDNDGIPDAVEAGDSDIDTYPVDTDGDFIPDFRDVDSDNDGLSDAWEHENGLDPTNEDSDGDGVPDLIEVSASTDPLDGSSYPGPSGCVFTMIYSEPGLPPDEVTDPRPTMDTLVLQTGSTGPMAVTAVLHDDPSDEVDTVEAFIDYTEPNVTGGVADPRDPSRICVADLEVADLHEPFDGLADAFTLAPAETAVCFDVTSKPNRSVEPLWDDPQVFACDMELVGEGGEVLDSNTIYFIVPPYVTESP